MTYTKQTWADGAPGGTPIDAARLGHMEDGIAGAHAGIAPTATYPAGALTFTIDEPGRYIPAGWGQHLSAALILCLTTHVDLGLNFGDSTSYGQVNVGPEPYPWFMRARALLVQAGFPDGGLGGYTFPSGSTDNGVSLTGLSNHPIFDGAGDWGGQLAGAAGQYLPSNGLSFATTVNPDSKTFFYITDKVRIFYLKSSAYSTGTFKYNNNGAGDVTVDATSASLDYGVITLTGVKGQLNTLKITNTGAALHVGIDAYNNVGFVLHNSGIPGQTMATRFDYTAGASIQMGNAIALGLAAGLAAVAGGSYGTTPTGPRAPGFASLYLAINDQQSSTTLAAAQTNAAAIAAGIAIFADGCRAGGVDPLIIIPHLFYANHAEFRGVIEQALWSAARANGCAIFDAGQALGYGSAQATYQASGGHLNKLGYDTVAAAFVNKMLKPFFPTGLTPVKLPPAARLTLSAASGNTPVSITLDASASYVNEAGATITSYTFDPGDGTSPVTQAGATLSHSYTTAGTYSPKVTVTDSNGKTTTLTLPNAITTTTVVYLVTDTMTAADNTLLSAHTADTGQSWVGNTGAHKIVSNKLQYISGPGVVALDAGATGKVVQADMVMANGDSVGLIAAYLDANNFIAAFRDGGSNKFTLYAFIAGSGSFGTVAGVTSTGAGTATAQVTGGNLVVTWNGVTVLTAALTGPQAAAIAGYTKYGIYGGGPGGTSTEDTLHVIQ